MDLRVLVAQMQTDAFAWETLHFITERKSVGLVKEAKQAAAHARGRSDRAAQPSQSAAASAGAGAAAAADDEPPPLE